MFIETLEFTIPVDLCEVFSTLKNGPQSNVEFPASVNSYGTTQDANILVALRANKITVKVDGVSSNASIVSKSECKTLKLSVFDVDTSSMPPGSPGVHESTTHHTPGKRRHDILPALSPPMSKSQRTSISETRSQSFDTSHSRHLQSSARTLESSPDFSAEGVILKTEPEDLIEIDPDPENVDDAVPHKEFPQAGMWSYEQVPSVSHYEASNSQGRSGDQRSGLDFHQFKPDADHDDNENSNADFSNDGFHSSVSSGRLHGNMADESGLNLARGSLQGFAGESVRLIGAPLPVPRQGGLFQCQQCDKTFGDRKGLKHHKDSVHDMMTFPCVCGKVYKYRNSLHFHHKTCSIYLAQTD